MTHSLLCSINCTNAPLSAVCSTCRSHSCSCGVWAAATAGKALCRFNKSVQEYVRRTNTSPSLTRLPGFQQDFRGRLFQWKPGFFIAAGTPAVVVLWSHPVWHRGPMTDQWFGSACSMPWHPPGAPFSSVWLHEMFYLPLLHMGQVYLGLHPVLLIWAQCLPSKQPSTASHHWSYWSSWLDPAPQPQPTNVLNKQRTVSNNTTEQTSIVMRNCWYLNIQYVNDQ